MDPKTKKSKQIEVTKFVPRLILKWGIRNVSILTLNRLRSPLRIVLPNISFAYYMESKTVKLSFLFLHLVCNQRILKVSIFVHFGSIQYLTAKLNRLESKHKQEVIIIYHCETFCSYIKSVTSVFQPLQMVFIAHLFVLRTICTQNGEIEKIGLKNTEFISYFIAKLFVFTPSL